MCSCSRYSSELEDRICNSINIHVYKNGVYRQTPYLINIPPKKLECMAYVIDAIAERVSFKVGYPEYLYNMDGTQVLSPDELVNYGCYVVATNLDKYFEDVPYFK
jgi:hypothetical protein